MTAPESSVNVPFTVPVVGWAGALETISAAARSKKQNLRNLNILPLFVVSTPNLSPVML